jgi:outer membrane protein OmpA-like peptidoglycan-associated protein
MKDMKSYLPDEFTVELDFWVNNYLIAGVPHQRYFLNFYDENNERKMQLNFGGQDAIHWEYYTPDEDFRSGNLPYENEKTNSWNHLSVSFNKRAFKAYINGVRVTNIPNMALPKNLSIEREHWEDHRTAITNIRIAKGAVPLYDRMLSDGKFITYGITFDVGKSTIKPESMGEINRIVTLMKENPELKFSVEGHTDSTGNAASNQTLSEARSQAVVDKLVANGIAGDRLKAAGKGQTAPIADNGTDEGKAKNRRVEFVKL